MTNLHRVGWNTRNAYDIYPLVQDLVCSIWRHGLGSYPPILLYFLLSGIEYFDAKTNQNKLSMLEYVLTFSPQKWESRSHHSMSICYKLLTFCCIFTTSDPLTVSGEVTFPHGLVPKSLQPGPNLVPINKRGNIKTQPIHALPPSKETVLHLGVCLGSKKSLLRRVFWLEANLSWSTWNHLSNLHDSMWWLVLNYSKQQFWG